MNTRHVYDLKPCITFWGCVMGPWSMRSSGHAVTWNLVGKTFCEDVGHWAIILKWIMFKPVTVKRLRVSGVEKSLWCWRHWIALLQGVGQTETATVWWCHLLGSARSCFWSSPDVQAPNKLFLENYSDTDSCLAAQYISRLSCTHSWSLSWARWIQYTCPRPVFNIVLSSRRTSPPCG
jgi:hypothetical protein